MEDTKQLTLVGNETPEQAEAIGLHYEIVSAAQAAARSNAVRSLRCALSSAR